MGYGCAKSIPLNPSKSHDCKPDRATIKEAAMYLMQLKDNPVFAVNGILISSDSTSEQHARCLDQILRGYDGGRYGIIRHEEDYWAIGVMH
ncbi:hypothetical protein J4234_06130 [Candidatus Woesearchaeota archaeon]|nr:hypothetical protein [Candidatus Woesearchaeota archaeon]